MYKIHNYGVESRGGIVMLPNDKDDGAFVFNIHPEEHTSAEVAEAIADYIERRVEEAISKYVKSYTL